MHRGRVQRRVHGLLEAPLRFFFAVVAIRFAWGHHENSKDKRFIHADKHAVC